MIDEEFKVGDLVKARVIASLDERLGFISSIEKSTRLSPSSPWPILILDYDRKGGYFNEQELTRFYYNNR